MKYLFYLELLGLIVPIIYLGWILYPYFKSIKSNFLVWSNILNKEKKKLIFSLIPLLLSLGIMVTVGPVRYTNEVFLWQWQNAKIEKLASKEHEIVKIIKSPKKKELNEKAYLTYASYISGPIEQLREREKAIKKNEPSESVPEFLEESFRNLDKIAEEHYNEIIQQERFRKKSLILGEIKVNKNIRKGLVDSMKDEAVEASELTFLEFMDSKTYYDNKDSLNKIVKAKMI